MAIRAELFNGRYNPNNHDQKPVSVRQLDVPGTAEIPNIDAYLMWDTEGVTLVPEKGASLSLAPSADSVVAYVKFGGDISLVPPGLLTWVRNSIVISWLEALSAQN